MSEYKVLFACRLTHEYYKDRRCRGMEVAPSPETVAMMKRRGFVWKKTGVNEWGMLEPEEAVKADDDEAVLKVKVTDRVLWNVSVDRELEPEIRVALKDLKRGEVVELDYRVKNLRWEYLFIRRQEGREVRIELTEAAGRLNFEEKENVELGGRKALRIVSRESVGMCEGFDYQLRLVEWRNPGKRVLIKNVSFPVPGQFIAGEADCVRQVVFY